MLANREMTIRSVSFHLPRAKSSEERASNSKQRRVLLAPEKRDQMTVSKTLQEPSKRETIAERTSAAATEIIDKQTSARLEKTARLRKARLKQEQALEIPS